MQKTKRGRGRPRRREDQEAPSQRSWRVGWRERFALTLLSRQSGVDEAVLLKQLITERANQELTEKTIGAHWLNIYEPDAGVTKLRLFALPRYRPNAEEERVKAFVAAHAPFFYSDAEQRNPYGERVTVLWGDVVAYAKAWHATKRRDVWAVAREMAAALKKAGASVPPGNGKW